jgi:TolB-like protein
MRLPLLFAELKRRKVFKVAAVYGATSFVLLQIADIVFPALGLPQWTITLVVAIIVIAFPLVLVMTWIFEATPDGLRRTAPADRAELEAIAAQPRSRRWPAGIAALAGILLLAGGVTFALGTRGGGRATTYDSIAVLPFVNMSGDAENEYFGDGLAEELLNALAGIDGLKVAARTSAFAFKGTNMDVRAIGDTLGVMTVLEGSVRRSANHIRITAQLIDARTGYHLWSENYDRPLTDLFAVQDEISREIVGALAGKFTTSDEGLYRGGTANVKAYDLYLLGRQKWSTREVPQLREAVQHFEDAIALDSSFALAWSGFADAIDALAWRDLSQRHRVAEAKYAAQRAIVLDPDLAEGWASLAVLATDFDRDFRLAEPALRRAIALRPSYATAYQWLADLLQYSGRPIDALAVSSQGLELDPKNGQHYMTQIETLMALGRFEEAGSYVQPMLATGFREAGVFRRVLSGMRVWNYTPAQAEAVGRDWAAAARFSRPDDIAVIARGFVDPSVRPRARELIAALDAAGARHFDLAAFSAGQEDYEAAMTHLEGAYADQDPSLILISTLYEFNPLRKDPRFIRLIQQLGVANGIQP